MKEFEKNKIHVLDSIFVYIQWLINSRIANYLAISTRLKSDKKTSKTAVLFFSTPHRSRFFLKTFSLLVLTNVLLSCTSIPIKPEGDFQLENRQFLYELSDWSFSGKIGYSDSSKSFSASIKWSHQQFSDKIELSGPFGQGRTLITLSPQSVIIDNGDERHEYIGNIDKQVSIQSGLSVPVSALKYWILGLVKPKTEYLPLDNGFIQSGWTVNYQTMQLIKLNQMPRKIKIKKDDNKFKLIINHWNL